MTPIDPEEEADILECLEHERHMFAWTLTRCAGIDPEVAARAAMSLYGDAPTDEDGRDLLKLKFHDGAWHLAMLHIHGEGYWWQPWYPRYQKTLAGAWAEYLAEFEASWHR